MTEPTPTPTITQSAWLCDRGHARERASVHMDGYRCQVCGSKNLQRLFTRADLAKAFADGYNAGRRPHLDALDDARNWTIGGEPLTSFADRCVAALLGDHDSEKEST